MSERMSRRDFLRLAAAVPVGIAVGKTTFRHGSRIDNAVEEHTGRPAGNAGIVERKKVCFTQQGSEETCGEGYVIHHPDRLYATTYGPITEEVVLRMFPSMILNGIETGNVNRKGILTGGNLTLNRKELLFGVATSVIGGLEHNIVLRKGETIDTKTIPASITAYFFIYWYLQRALGFLSNTTAHILHNVLSTR